MLQRGGGEHTPINRAKGVFTDDDTKGGATLRERDEVVGAAAAQPKRRSVVAVVERPQRAA
eukprot:CAMPEP_0172529628 /NCGR_PEP_ID=MMETSP1067-20121228/3670_1 /TAXON_ID=265564 ORGANISM="Thalassiosira punctigera, Strain Tpunct2005C2" /NCGR_SAMPLE_ID=MMETSP1067 /ASSEMBLY_ACC=CAM_ASM_000444 /LENGTH=60 /DNA_ID=CAMNT_0013313721 /DNA_START=122 /DNA_END=300 /DNA_ORIENTATION=+